MKTFESLKFRYKDSFIHKMDPRVKLILAISFFTITMIVKEIYSLIFLFLIEIIILISGKVIKLWILSLKIILFITLMVFFITFIAYRSTEYSIFVAIRWVVLFSSFSWFILTTSPDDIGQSLEKMHFPYIFSFAVTLATRFVPVVANEMQLVVDAQISRGLKIDTKSPIKKIKNVLPVIVPIIVNVIRRSFELSESLSARAYGISKKRTKLYEIKMKSSDYIILILAIVYLIFSIYVSIYFLSITAF